MDGYLKHLFWPKIAIKLLDARVAALRFRGRTTYYLKRWDIQIAYSTIVYQYCSGSIERTESTNLSLIHNVTSLYALI